MERDIWFLLAEDSKASRRLRRFPAPRKRTFTNAERRDKFNQVTGQQEYVKKDVMKAPEAWITTLREQQRASLRA